MSNIANQGFRLSPQQEHLWELHRRGSGQSYRVQVGILVEGNLDAEILRDAVKLVVTRNEILRTVFHRRPGMTTAFQVVSDKATFSWEEVDHSGLVVAAQSEAAEKVFQQKIGEPFDFEHGPLLRASLITEGPGRYKLTVSLPALCGDTWTLSNLIQEISNAYAACLNGAELSDNPLQYVDFSEWNNQLLETADENAEQGKAFWDKQDSSSLPVMTLPFEIRGEHTQQCSPQIATVAIPPGVITRIDEINKKTNASTASYLLACWTTLLWRLTGERDIVIDSICDGRKYEEFKEAMGPYSRSLPISYSFHGDGQFSEVLKQVHQLTGKAVEWEEYFTRKQTTDSDRTTLFLPIGFEFKDQPAKLSVADLTFSPDRYYSWTEPFKIKLVCTRVDDHLTVEVYYDPAFLQAESVERIARHFDTLVKSASENPERPIEELDVLTEAERHRLLIAFNQTAADYPRDNCIHELFEEQAARTPDAIAVQCGDQQLTFAALNARANQLAHWLRAKGVSSDTRVGLCVDRSVQMLVGLLGILKAGGAYVPLNPDHPKARLAQELTEIQSPVLVTQETLLGRLPDFDRELICLDKQGSVFEYEPTVNPERIASPQNLVYVIYTSGSTGTPKGVAVNHQSLVNYAHFVCRKLQLPSPSSNAGLHFAIVSTISADLGNTCIFPSLISGGCLHIVSYDVAAEAQLFSEYLAKHSIDVLKIVPSHLSALLGAQEVADILPRKWLILGGEALSTELAEQISEKSPGCKIINHYGPTETTVGSLTFNYTGKNNGTSISSTVSIGRPIANTEVYILDRLLKPVPEGVPGQLFIGGEGLARGYLNRPQQTADRFISNPFSDVGSSRLYRTGDLARFLPDGYVEFLGRTDNQVKIRGFRVELGEIESVLNQDPSIRQSVVIAREDVPGDVRIVAYLVTREPIVEVNELRSRLREQLPDYMVPSAFVMVRALPLTPNGKVDRNALPAPDSQDLATVYVAPRTPTEEMVAGVWVEVLRTNRIGVDDNFFDLGGHSLLVTQVIARLRKVFQVEIPLRWLFESPTVAEIAQRIEKIDQPQTHLMLDELEYLTDEEAQRLLDLESRYV